MGVFKTNGHRTCKVWNAIYAFILAYTPLLDYECVNEFLVSVLLNI